MNRIPSILAAVALVLGALAHPAAHAAGLTYTSGDLLLGFYNRDTGTQYTVNLGAASLYRDATTPITLSLGDIGADLAENFGSDWNGQANLYWGVFGALQQDPRNGDIAYTVYAGRATTPGTRATAYLSGSEGTLSVQAGSIEDVGRAFALVDNSPTSNSNVATVQDIAATNGFASKQTSNEQTSFGAFNNALGNFQGTETGTALDLFRLVPGSAANRTNAYEGTFTIDGSGQVTFTPVPEPATVLLLSASLLVLVVIARRRHARLRA